ncbi:MAG TPA: efflux RND transporter periplasmic adaptor subunit [Gammaproteobacteria bacterium]|nr:efflux RND transporter periplasmic adaptor subunit [Gammaproteobacteria bacterium]
MFSGKYAANSVVISSFILALSLAGCESNTYVEPPPPKVTVAQPLIQDVTDYLEFTGTLVASEKAEARARVSGVLQSMHFIPGTSVTEGDLLFVIDPAEYQADLQAAQAELAGAKSNYDRAKIEYGRAQTLYKKKAGAEADVVKWRVERELASADILRAEAKVARAELNLGYTQVTAPLTGRVGRNEVDIGNLVGEGEATVLTEVTLFDPIYVYFNLNERDLLRVRDIYKEVVEAKGLNPDAIGDREMEIPLYLGLANEEGYPHEGLYDFAESGVDPETGTLRLRGILDNPGAAPDLLPGLFARIRMPLGNRPDMPLVTERAIGNDQSGTYLLVVNSKDVVERRSVKTGQRKDGLIVIEDGLLKDDRVVVNGIQRARPGRKVAPEPVDMASLTASAMRQAAQQVEQDAQMKRSNPTTETGD